MRFQKYGKVSIVPLAYKLGHLFQPQSKSLSAPLTRTNFALPNLYSQFFSQFARKSFCTSDRREELNFFHSHHFFFICVIYKKFHGHKMIFTWIFEGFFMFSQGHRFISLAKIEDFSRERLCVSRPQKKHCLTPSPSQRFFSPVKIKSARETYFLPFFQFFSQVQNPFHGHFFPDFHA